MSTTEDEFAKVPAEDMAKVIKNRSKRNRREKFGGRTRDENDKQTTPPQA